MPTLAEMLYAEIRKVRVIDVHSHVRQGEPCASSLRDILSYHYFTELAFSSGLAKEEMAADLPDDRMIPALVEAMARFDNTVQYGWLIDAARKLFDLADHKLTADNWRALNDTAARKLGADGWMDEVLRRANIEKVFLTNSFFEDLDGFDRERLVPCLRIDDLVFHLDQVVDQLSDRGGVSVSDTGSLKKALAAVVDYFVSHDARSAAISLPPGFTCRAVSDADAAPLLATALKGKELSPADRAALSAYVLYLIAENCRARRLPMQLMIGVIRGAYRHGVRQGTDIVSNRDSLEQYADLFNRFHDVTFTVSYLSTTMAHELLAYTWIFRNVVASGHWWYANVPGIIEADMRSRIEALPRTKMLGYYSDAYYVELALPKFDMYRGCLARVLAGQVEMKRLTEADALAVARCLLRDNAKAIFNV